MSSGLMSIDCRFWRKFWLIKVEELEWRQERGTIGDKISHLNSSLTQIFLNQISLAPSYQQLSHEVYWQPTQ